MKRKSGVKKQRMKSRERNKTNNMKHADNWQHLLFDSLCMIFLNHAFMRSISRQDKLADREKQKIRATKTRKTSGNSEQQKKSQSCRNNDRLFSSQFVRFLTSLELNCEI